MMMKHDDNHVELHVLILTKFAIVYGYASPKASFSDLQNAILTVFKDNHLAATTTLLMGDFNKDMNTVAGVKLVNLMKSLGMASCLPTICSTTRSGSQIDCIFSGIQGIEAYVSTTLTSHHDPLFVFVPDEENKCDDDDCTLEALMKLKITTDHHGSNCVSNLAPCVQMVHMEDMNLASSSNVNSNGSNQAKCTSPSSQPGSLNPSCLKSSGLINPPGRNLCFANSTIQSLIQHSFTMDDTIMNQECAYTELIQLANQIKQLNSNGNVTRLLKALSNTIFTNNQQHDSIEFLHNLIDQLHLETTLYSTNPEIISDNFRVQLQEIEYSEVCDHRIVTQNPFWYIPLPIIDTSPEASLEHLLQNFFRTTTTDLKTCPKCSTKHKLQQRISFQREPETMIIQLGRFLE
jgi:hypothetical protein